MRLSAIPIMAEPQVRKLPRQFQEREALLVRLKREATRQEQARKRAAVRAEQLAEVLDAERARARREALRLRREEWRERLATPDPEGSARLQSLVDEELEYIKRKSRSTKEVTA